MNPPFDMTETGVREQQLADTIARLAESEALHRAIVATSLDCLIIVDGDGRVVDFNPAAERLFGYSRAEALGREIGALIVPEKYRAAHYAGMARYISTGVTSVIGKRVELEAMTRDGAMVPVELALADVSVGDTRFFTAHIRDLSAAKSAQLEIERQRESLYQKEKLAALGSLLSGVAHELNNPLSIVLGQAMMLREMIGRQANAFAGGQDFTDRAIRIETAANRCARVVKTFLAMARQRKAERNYVSIAKVVADAAELLSYSLKTSDVMVEIELEKGLPETFADADLIHQVLVNLIVNARQALEEKGGADRRIWLSATHERGNDAIVVHIRDNGGGIPSSIRNRIFDPFFTTKPQDHGTGIGLAVSRGLIEAHGGTLDLAIPQPDTGAEFVIRLPIAGKNGADIETVDNVSSHNAPVVRAQAHVLVVDDEPDLAELIAEIAGGLGYRTTVATSGHAAQRLISASELPIAAILCDIRMPDGDGPGLYDWLSANRPELMSRIGFVTGDTLGPSAGRFLARTGCPVIEKPFAPDDIARVLDTLIT
ncbi:PAS domain S-box protein [Rhizobium sp. KVB221]|uniref:histidine kinase n=1 Tax=Rhizobium setariae TaxID=2801340 RepID=A0A936YLN3_9HYPH|nr:PAS domain S-box protein [Rhizobium setariae]MBL0371012.1 PAS domain S-box protein [Rhizobium setariae]